MKLLNHYKLFFVFLFALGTLVSTAQDSKPSLLLDLVYHQKDNVYPFVSVFTKSKVERKFLPVANISVAIYLGQATDDRLIGTILTDKDGKGMVTFPVNLQKVWDSVSSFHLIATTAANKQYESVTTESDITKSRISIDTTWADGVRSVVVNIKAKKGKDWVSAGEVETKVIIKRSVGNLSVGDDENYTTDSSGTVTAEFKKTTIPGDEKGNLTIVAKTDENEKYGSITIEKTLPWGIPFVANDDHFNHRTLYATRDKAPIWLILLAGSIFVSVWSVLVYLVFQIIKIRKAGLHS
jgi:hypothetical protein